MPLIDLTRTVGGAILTVDGKGKRLIGNQIVYIDVFNGKIIFSLDGRDNIEYKITGNSFSINSSTITGTDTEIRDAFRAVISNAASGSTGIPLNTTEYSHFKAIEATLFTP